MADGVGRRSAHVLVTGATGFVGRRLCETLEARGLAYRGAIRNGSGAHRIAVGDIGPDTQWAPAVDGFDVVVHLAARVHVMHDDATDPLAAYRDVNLHGTLNLARQAAKAGVRRFVFVSSIKVNGELTVDKPFSEADEPKPSDPYGQSKLEAEQALLELGRNSAMEIVIVRPPLVYGPGVKANFRNLMKLVCAGVPLPLGRANGRRSMIAVDNLVDLLILCMFHPAAANQVFLASDGADLTVAELVHLIARAMHKPGRLLPVPMRVVQAFASLVGRKGAVQRLFGALQVDASLTRRILGWTPVVSPETAIAETVAHFMSERAKA